MRILTGIQPSGTLHLGNYFGTMRPYLTLTEKSGENFLMIADLHALTTLQDPKKLREATHNVILDFLACGFDPKKTVIFRQSDIHEHAELMWILSTVSPMGLLERAVSYKEKVQKGIGSTVGLFAYPVLQAADIFLYDADSVPVGKDQKQHLEIARDIAVKFNAAYGETFTLPEPLIREDVAVVPGTDGQKMSKSYGNTIPIFGTDAEIKKAIMGIVTDSKGVEESKDTKTNTVYQLHKLFLDDGAASDLAERYTKGGLGYGDAKKLLLEAYHTYFDGMREKRAELEKEAAYVDQVLEDGKNRAGAIAKKTMERVKKACGLL